MGYGNCVIVNDTPENREVAGNAGLYFRAHDAASLPRALAEAAAPERAVDLRSAAAVRAAEKYSWNHVCQQYEELFARLTEHP